MYRMFKSLWFTKEDVNFVVLEEGAILVKFDNIEDRKRAFNFTLFWVRIFNIPLEYMDRQVAMDVGKAIGEVVDIDWRNKDGGWKEYIWLRVIIDVLKPLRRMHNFLAVSFEGCSGLALIWRKRVDVAIQSFSKHHIDSLVRVGGSVREDWVVGVVFNAILNKEKKDNGCKKSGGSMIEERVDRFLTSVSVIEKFSFMATSVVRQTKADHHAIIMDMYGRKPKEHLKYPRLCFKFDECWATNKEAKSIISNAWNSGGSNFVDKFDRVRSVLGLWDDSVNALKESRCGLSHLYAKEEKYWAQRSLSQWLREGDRNTCYFHARATGHLKKNNTDKVKDLNGNWCVTKETNEWFVTDYTESEVIQAIKEMDLRKAPGVDGLSGSFFKYNWETVGDETILFCLDVVENLDNYLGLSLPVDKKKIWLSKRSLTGCLIGYTVGLRGYYPLVLKTYKQRLVGRGGRAKRGVDSGRCFLGRTCVILRNVWRKQEEGFKRTTVAAKAKKINVTKKALIPGLIKPSRMSKGTSF
ncbi:hypothetical protein GOBAR_DD28427 [Gossypium barbadense]|nr:hypothetical protein GOBAR_DD28427 [Gossypium barbadense]